MAPMNFLPAPVVPTPQERDVAPVRCRQSSMASQRAWTAGQGRAERARVEPRDRVSPGSMRMAFVEVEPMSMPMCTAQARPASRDA